MPIESTSRTPRSGAFWLALRFPEAWFESRCPEEELVDRPPAVELASRSGRARVIAVNRPAAALGIECGQSLAIARSRHRAGASEEASPLRCLTADAAVLDEWLSLWGEWAGEYTSRVTRPPAGTAPGLLLEVGGSAALFGGLDPLIDALLQSLTGHHLVVRAAAAPHPRVAWALAAVAGEGEVWRCGRHAQLAEVSRLPLAALDWPEGWISQFAELGLERLGEVRRLPRAGLGMRAGSALLDDLDRLFAERDWPLPDLVPPTRYAREVSLWDPASQVDRLLLIARAPLVGLAGFLHRRRLAVASFRLLLEHEDRPDTEMTVATAVPGRDERLWLDQLRLRLESFVGLPPVIALRVEADRFETPASGQGRLFADDGEREEDEQVLCHRLRARLGDVAVGRLHSVPGLVPSQCSRFLPLDSAGPAGTPSSAARFRPLWWLDVPRRPESAVSRRAEIERVETAWWSAAEEAADYCAGELSNGRAVCLRRERSADGWQLVGLDG